MLTPKCKPLAQDILTISNDTHPTTVVNPHLDNLNALQTQYNTIPPCSKLVALQILLSQPSTLYVVPKISYKTDLFHRLQSDLLPIFPWLC